MTTPPVPAMPQQSRLLGQLRNTIRLKHYRIRTEPAYVDRIGRFVLPDDKRHPSDMGAAEIEGYAFDSKLTNGRVEAANAQIQAAKAKARGYGTVRHLITMAYLLAGKLTHLPACPFQNQTCAPASA